MNSLSTQNKNLREMTIKNLKDVLGPGINLLDANKQSSNTSTTATKHEVKASQSKSLPKFD
jgi:hypothetical protein